MENILDIHKIQTSYGKRQILHSVSLSVPAGGKVLLIGPNGSGKSTLLKSVMGLLRLQRGSIWFNGEEIGHSSVRKRVASGISFLLQTRNIVPGLSVDENLALGGYSLTGDEVSVQKERVLELLWLLTPKLKQRAGLLSGGERQALALGMILMQRPQLLLLDEPSAGLAPKAALNVIQSIKGISEIFDLRAICMVEHNLKTTLPWAEKVVVLVEGQIAFESQEPSSFVSKPEMLEKHYFEMKSS